MRTNQTLEFSRKMAKKYDFETPRAHMTIHEAFDVLKNYVRYLYIYYIYLSPYLSIYLSRSLCIYLNYSVFINI